MFYISSDGPYCHTRTILLEQSSISGCSKILIFLLQINIGGTQRFLVLLLTGTDLEKASSVNP